MTELGIGYYTKLSKRAILELYGIAGRGPFESAFFHSNLKNSGEMTANITKYAIQGNLGFRSRALELAFS